MLACISFAAFVIAKTHYGTDTWFLTKICFAALGQQKHAFSESLEDGKKSKVAVPHFIS